MPEEKRVFINQVKQAALGCELIILLHLREDVKNLRYNDTIQMLS
jgi:hypothetical protein